MDGQCRGGGQVGMGDGERGGCSIYVHMFLTRGNSTVNKQSQHTRICVINTVARWSSSKAPIKKARGPRLGPRTGRTPFPSSIRPQEAVGTPVPRMRLQAEVPCAARTQGTHKIPQQQNPSRQNPAEKMPLSQANKHTSRQGGEKKRKKKRGGGRWEM